MSKDKKDEVARPTKDDPACLGAITKIHNETSDKDSQIQVFYNEKKV